MSKIDYTNTDLESALKALLEEIKPVQSNRKARRAKKRRMGLVTRANYPTCEPTAVVHDRVFTHEGNLMRLPRVDIKRDVGLPSTLQHVVKYIDSEDRFPVATIHMRNQLDEDEKGFRPPIDERIIAAAESVGWCLFQGKHLYPVGLLPLLARTFPTAVGARSYVSGLGAATIGGGLWSNLSMVICDIISEDSEGNTILAGADGHGGIHSQHVIFEILGTVCIIQIRIWNEQKGYFFKGILFPDDRAVTPDGKPGIHLDPLQCKGARKAQAKSFHGSNSGAFSPAGMLIDPSKLQVFLTGEGYHTGILQKWDRPGTMKLGFEDLQMCMDTEQNREWIYELCEEAVLAFWDNGGLYGLFERLCEDDPLMDMVRQLCEKMNYDPLRIKFVWTRVQEDLKRFLYHLAQGAGAYGDRYVLRMDDGIPEGYCVIGTSPGGAQYSHMQEVAVTRIPSVLPQGHLVLKVIDPFHTEEDGSQPWYHLRHLAIKTEKGLKLVPEMIAICTRDTLAMFGDSDGDALKVLSDPRWVGMFKTRRTFMGNQESRFLLEPEKDAGGAKARIPTIGPDGMPTEEGRLILGLDGRGPVGALTMFQAGFIAMGDGMGALALAAMIQRAIDLQKHDALLWDPEKLVNPANWDQVEPNVFKPKDGCHASKYWYDPSGTGDKCDIGKLAKWFGKRVGAKLGDVLTWRKDSSKKVQEDEWGIMPGAGENLVHYCNRAAFEIWQREKAKRVDSPSEEVELLPMLPNALGVDRAGYTLDPTSPEYRDCLLKRSGLIEYSDALDKARTDKAAPEVRNARMNAETALLGEKLRGLSLDELVAIWCTELAAIELDPRYEKSKINRAIRAVCFDGSPVLAKLGIEVTFPCDYMQNGKLDEVYGSLQANVDAGRARDIFHAVALFEESDALHELHKGTKVRKCKHCKDMLSSMVISKSRSEKHGDNKAVVAKVAYGMNLALGHGKYRKNKKK